MFVLEVVASEVLHLPLVVLPVEHFVLQNISGQVFLIKTPGLGVDAWLV